MLKTLSEGAEACITVTLLDGLILARSAFHHSMNYRSVVLFGKAERVDDEKEKNEALKQFMEQLIPGRWDAVRKPSQQELLATSVLRFQINEVTAKLREGPPIDDEDDYQMDVWAGEIPYSLRADNPISDPRLNNGINVPDHVRTFIRTHPVNFP